MTSDEEIARLSEKLADLGLLDEVRAALAEEREACAKLIEDYHAAHKTDGYWKEAHAEAIQEMAALIRLRP